MRNGYVAVSIHDDLAMALRLAAINAVKAHRIYEGNPKFLEMVDERFTEYFNKIVDLPVENYRFVHDLLLGNYTYRYAELTGGKLAGLLPGAFARADENGPFLSEYIDDLVDGIGYKVTKPKACFKWYLKNVPEYKTAMNEVRTFVQKALVDYDDRHKAELAEVKSQRREKSAQYRDFMRELKSRDRERYDKLTVLHKIEDKQTARFEKLFEKLHKAELKSRSYSLLRQRVRLNSKEEAEFEKAEREITLANLEIAKYKATIQSQLKLLRDEGVITDDYYAIRADQVDRGDFTYRALDRWSDAYRNDQVSTGLLSHDFNRYEEHIESLRRTEYSADVSLNFGAPVGYVPQSLEEEIALFDAQCEVKAQTDELYAERAEKSYQKYMAQLKREDPKQYKALSAENKLAEAQNKQYRGLAQSVAKWERERFICERTLATDPENKAAAERLSEVEASLRNAKSTLTTFKEVMIRSLDEKYARGEVSETYNTMRKLQLSTGDLSFRPVNNLEAACHNRQLPQDMLDMADDLGRVTDRLADLGLVDLQPELDGEGERVDFRGQGISFGSKGRDVTRGVDERTALGRQLASEQLESSGSSGGARDFDNDYSSSRSSDIEEPS